MPIEIKKKEKETTQGLLYRFKKATQQSGVLVRARSLKFREKPQNKRARKIAALRRLEAKKEYELKRKFAKPGDKKHER